MTSVFHNMIIEAKWNQDNDTIVISIDHLNKKKNAISQIHR